MNLNEINETDLTNRLNNINPKDWGIYKDKRLNFWERSKAKDKIKHFIKEKKEAHAKLAPWSATKAVETTVVNHERQLTTDIKTLENNQLKGRERIVKLELKKTSLGTQLETV